uniref:Uncharacterized protein n=1 Tax=Zea mays TaxID=4577 RepID=C0P7R0_MAIZE|nr:unknown [Zea mays]
MYREKICIFYYETVVCAYKNKHRHASWPGIQVWWQPGHGDGLERDQARHGEPELLLHVQLLRRHAIRQPPREGVQQVGQGDLHHLEPEDVARAHPAAGPEREQLQVVALHVHGAADEPLRAELLRVVAPHGGVAADGPDVDEHERAPRDVVAARGRVLAAQPRRQQRRHRVQAEGLLHDGLQVRQVRDVLLGDQAAVADDAVQLLGDLGEDLGLPQELRHGPLDGHRRGVRAASDQVQRESLDAIPFDGDLEFGVVGELQQQVHHVRGDEPAALPPPPLVVLVHHVLQEAIEHLAQPLHPPDVALEVQPAEPRDEVPDAEHAVEEEELVDHPAELGRRDRRARGAALADVLPAQRHARDHVEAVHEQVLLERDGPPAAPGRARGGRRRQGAQQDAQLLAADVLLRPELPVAEQMGLPELARLAPVRPAGRPDDVGVVVGGVLPGRHPGAVDERRVAGPEEEPGRFHGGADDDGDGAEAERHERAVPRGERVDGAVRERADQVEVADHRPRPRPGWHLVLAAGAALPAEDGDEEDGGGEHDAQERV